MSMLDHLRPILALFFAERRGVLIGGMALAAATVLAGIALLGLSGWFITATAIAGLSVATAIVFDVFAPAAGIRLLAILRTGARYGERLVTHDATLAVLAALRERLFRAHTGPGIAHDLLMRPARLLFRLTADIDALDSLYLRVLVPAGAALAAAIAAGVVFYLVSPLLGLAVAGLLLLAGLGLPVIAAMAAEKPMRRRAKAVEALRARTIDIVAGQTELVMAGRLGAKADTIAYADHRQAAADDALNRLDTALIAGFGAAGALLLTGVLVGVTMLVQGGAIGAPVAALGLLVALAAMEPFTALRRGAMELGRTVLAARRLTPRLKAADEPLAHKAPQEGRVARLIAVTACHHGARRPALRDVSLDLRAGEKLALVGTSGAGKSTLLAVLAGEIAQRSGSVETAPATLLTQRTELFQDTLRENLRLANPAADDAALWTALEDAGLLGTVAGMPDGLRARLGEGGLGLSGGQSRRLALARLFLRDTPLWLLDEPTEGLDAATAGDVLARLKRKARGRTLVIATHTRREAALADRIFVLDQGGIVQSAGKDDSDFKYILNRLRQV